MLQTRLSRADHGSSPWLESAVFSLDRWLRRRHGIYEYSEDDTCLFRLQRSSAEERLTLADGTRVEIGDPILGLHLWNEHVPAMPDAGPSISWARTLSQAIDVSLRQLAVYLADQPAFDDIVAIRADMRLGTAEQGDQLARLAQRYGFEAPDVELDSSSSLHRLGENILVLLLVMASNPTAARMPVLWRDRKLVYLSRTTLERRYARHLPQAAGNRIRRLC